MSVNQGRNYVRLSLPDTGCSLATWHRDRAKVGSHLNISQKIKKEEDSQVFSAIFTAKLLFCEREAIRTAPDDPERLPRVPRRTSNFLQTSRHSYECGQVA